jgi:hypothetical protein
MCAKQLWQKCKRQSNPMTVAAECCKQTIQEMFFFVAFIIVIGAYVLWPMKKLGVKRYSTDGDKRSCIHLSRV